MMVILGLVLVSDDTGACTSFIASNRHWLVDDDTADLTRRARNMVRAVKVPVDSSRAAARGSADGHDLQGTQESKLSGYGVACRAMW